IKRSRSAIGCSRSRATRRARRRARSGRTRQRPARARRARGPRPRGARARARRGRGGGGRGRGGRGGRGGGGGGGGAGGGGGRGRGREGGESAQGPVRLSIAPGLPARPAAAFVGRARREAGEVTVACGPRRASGKSLVSLMALDARLGDDLTITVTGRNAAMA